MFKKSFEAKQLKNIEKQLGVLRVAAKYHGFSIIGKPPRMFV